MGEVGLSAELCPADNNEYYGDRYATHRDEDLLCLYGLSSNSMAAIFRSKAYKISIVSSSAAARP